jgi:hypothetical protein
LRTIKTLLFFAIVIAGASQSFAQTSITNIDQRTGWKGCDVCSGPGGAGTTTTYAITQAISSPAMDGSAAQFTLKPSTSYQTALWWNELGGHDTATHLVYDLYFYMTNPTAAQALEFDVNQTRSADATKYIFGTECDIRGTHTWRYYDNVAKKWTSTGVTCSTPVAYKWNHLTIEFQRVPATSTTPAQLKWVAVTLNGVKSYLNGTSVSRPGTGSYSHLNVAFQMDANRAATAYSTWLDKVTLTYW